MQELENVEKAIDTVLDRPKVKSREKSSFVPGVEKHIDTLQKLCGKVSSSSISAIDVRIIPAAAKIFFFNPDLKSSKKAQTANMDG